MLRSISNLPISRRLFIAFALAAVLPSVIIAIMGFYYASQLSNRGTVATLTSQAQDSTNALSSDLEKLSNQIKTLKIQVLNGLTSTPPALPATINAQIEQIQVLEQTFQQKLNDYQTRYNPVNPHMAPVQAAVEKSNPNDETANNENVRLTYVMKNSWPDYQNKLAAEIQVLQQVVGQAGTLVAPPVATGTTPGASTPVSKRILTDIRQINKADQDLDTSFKQLNSDWDLITGYLTKISGDANKYGTDNTPVVLGSISAFLLIVIVITFVGFAVQRSITGPLTELVSLTRRISKGDTNARVKIESRDEIAIVGNSMNNMLDNIVHLIQDAQAQRDVLQGQVEKLVSEVSGVGEGDLRVQAEVTADALGVLADSFNYMVEELGSLVVRVKMVARDVEESTTMTSDRMTELVEGADRQIQQIANAAIEIERMALNSQQVANRAQALASSAREARLSAQGGRQAVQQTIEGMGRIYTNVQETSTKVQNLGERSREINNIVDAISTIAHQTNRLALDAAIQAAMAGENGKGFGAVAADIRRLAERAKEQANSVGRIVRSVRDEIGAVAVSMRDTERETSAGARLAEEAGTSLESIFSVIERQAREIDVISQMATQQQQSSGSVVQIMQGVSESTQESSGSTREAAQNMERVARLAEQLLASVEAFKLRDNLNYFAPNANGLPGSDENPEGVLSASGAFRTVTATAQPISNGNNSYVALPAPPASNGFSQFASPFLSRNQNNSQSLLPPQGNGQQAFPPQRSNNSQPLSPSMAPPYGQQHFPSSMPNANDGQAFFPPQGNGQQPFQPFPPQGNRSEGVPPWSAPDDWQNGSGNW
ncbi:MAG TPA: methyl-accepting chemotaxis protein [Ktedonobacteraceae bacterium]|nr:methyl-accepting chemotaxis protein [Ktedonobacteraceae bacterium]